MTNTSSDKEVHDVASEITEGIARSANDGKLPVMTVGDLKEALVDMPDDAELSVSIGEGAHQQVCGEDVDSFWVNIFDTYTASKPDGTVDLFQLLAGKVTMQ